MQGTKFASEDFGGSGREAFNQQREGQRALIDEGMQRSKRGFEHVNAVRSAFVAGTFFRRRVRRVVRCDHVDHAIAQRAL